jgi:hypothetical protein
VRSTLDPNRFENTGLRTYGVRRHWVTLLPNSHNPFGHYRLFDSARARSHPEGRTLETTLPIPLALLTVYEPTHAEYLSDEIRSMPAKPVMGKQQAPRKKV